MTKRSNAEIRLQRAGGGGNPAVGIRMNNTFELQSEQIRHCRQMT